MSLYVDKIQLDNQELLLKDTEARQRLDNMLDRKYLFIGDSYLKYGDGTDPTRHITNYLPGYMGLSANDYYVYANGGAAFSREGNTFLSLLTTAHNEIEDPESITDIVVIGGYNDQYQNYDTVDSAVSLFCTTAKTYFSNAIVKLAFLGWSRTNDSSVKYALIDAMRAWQGCGKYGAVYINNSECINHNYTLYDGSVHPTPAGASNMARYLASALLGGYSCDVVYHMSSNCNIPSGETIVTSASGTIEQILHNNALTLTTYANIDIAMDNATITGAVNLVEMDTGLIYSIPDGFRFSTNAIVKRNNAWELVNGYFRFNRQILQFIPSINLTGVTNFRIMAFTLTGNTILN